MEFNELKIMVLEILEESEAMSSDEILYSLDDDVEIDPKALQMALLRYHRQGLLHREKRGRNYYYEITERGIDRLNWLRDN